MKRKTTLGALLALAATAPAVVAPRLVPVAVAQDAAATTREQAEYPDVPRNHWAYEAINRLSQAGIIEGYSVAEGGGYKGNRAMTRYEFAVAIARLLNNMPPPGQGIQGIQGERGERGERGEVGPAGPAAVGGITRQEVEDLIAALRREFADELSRLGGRVGALEDATAALAARVTAPPRLTISPSILHRTGAATYISQQDGRSLMRTQGAVGANVPQNENDGVFNNDDFVNGKYSYTDLELRLTDRVTDRLSVNAALRSLSNTNEDSWAGRGTEGDASAYLREAYAVANLGDRSFLGTRGLNLILGRQRTKIGQGLLYDNDLSPTDQVHGMFNVGPVALHAFIGTTNNNTLNSSNRYLTEGAVQYLGGSGAAYGAPYFTGANQADARRRSSGAAIGFPSATGIVSNGYLDDNESLISARFNLFKIGGNPVGIGITRQFDGVQDQHGDSIDLSVPLFNRTIGVEYVRQRQYFNGVEAPGNPGAYNITVPLFRARALDLNFAYGKADDDFEFFVSSAANPFARTYAEALFDRPMALGAPMISNLAGQPGEFRYAAAKKVFDVNGTLRIIRRLPLDFRWYRAYGTTRHGGGQDDRLDLGDVWSVGSTFNITPGLDLQLMYGQYNPQLNNYDTIKYVRVGANVGF